jgi:hypothetical protein
MLVLLWILSHHRPQAAMTHHLHLLAQAHAMPVYH